jgi:hypothetical protein
MKHGYLMTREEGDIIGGLLESENITFAHIREAEK